MGLSGRKVKQRIGNDPRNLSWVDDAARFGSNYLSKFGWDATKGLGVNGDGRTSHLKVAQKLDMLGIGAANQTDPDGLAWKQNKDFENLLRRLNQSDEEERTTVVVEGFVKPTGEIDGGGALDEGESGRRKKKEKKKGKDSEKKERKRKRDKEVEETDKESKKKKSDDDKSKPLKPEYTRAIPRHRSHRARHIAAKSIGSKSAAAISEILGIAPTPSPSGTQTPQQSKLTPIYEVDKVTTSTKSLEDYFKEKLGKVKRLTVEADYDDIPRSGLGSR